MSQSTTELVRQFCLIELQVLTDREDRLRREILHCKIQREYLTQIASDLTGESEFDSNQLSDLIKIGQKSGEY